MALKPKNTETTISVLPISQGTITLCVVGQTPLIFNSMSEKAKRELLMPRGKITSSADRAERGLKHNPMEEYRNSVYRTPTGPTRLVLPSTAFKGAMTSAALDLPGSKKTEIGRLAWVEGYNVPVWGVPQVLCSVVRMADIQKTPDIRTRAILPQWASKFTVSFVQPKMSEMVIVTLMAAAGIIRGVGDFRQEKGKGSFGMFRVVDEADEDFQRIIGAGGVALQDEALADPTPYDDDTDGLLTWFQEQQSAKVMPLKKKEAA